MPLVSPRARAWLVFTAALCLLLPAAAATGQQASSPATAPVPAGGIISAGSPVTGGPAPDLVVFYTGEVMGWTEPCG